MRKFILFVFPRVDFKVGVDVKAAAGRFWKVLRGSGRFRKILGRSERFLGGLEGSERVWDGLGGYGRLWKAPAALLG